MPENADYSTKAQVKAWIYGGNVPRNVLNIEPLIDELNKEIKERSVMVEMYDSDDELMLKTMDSELKKALDIQLGKYKNKKKMKKM